MGDIIEKGSSAALQPNDSLIMETKKENSYQVIKDKINEEYEDIKRYMRTRSQKKIVLEVYSPEKFGPLVTFDGIAGYIENERYWVNEPYAYVSILFNKDKNEYLYTVVEPELSVFERMILETIFENILDTFALYETQNSPKTLTRIFLTPLKFVCLIIYVVFLYSVIHQKYFDGRT